MSYEMNNDQKTIGYVLLVAILLFGFLGITNAALEGNFSKEQHEYNDHDDEDERRWKKAKYKKTRITKPISQAQTLYIEECGSCHMAYHAELLPYESWHAIMAGLADHFDESAELDKETSDNISNYLKENALKRNKHSKFSRMVRNLSGKAPIRITELPYFVHEHDDIPKRMVVDNPEVGSLSYCDKCHKDAAGGNFDENLVVIPGFGHWDD